MNDRMLEEGEIEEELNDEGRAEGAATKSETGLQNREWPMTYLHFPDEEPRMPKTFLHFKDEETSTVRVTRTAPYTTQRNKNVTQREPRENVRPKFIRRLRRRGSSIQRRQIDRNKDSKDQFSYEDLLSQYRDIQNQLEELKQEEDSNRNEKGKDGKENIKSSSKRSSTVGRRNSSRNRRHARSRSKSSANDSSKAKSPHSEEDEEAELRKLALASQKKSTEIKKSPERELSNEKEISTERTESIENVKSQIVPSHLYDNYEQVEMELDSNYSGGEEEDEESLRSNLLLSLHQKKKTVVIPIQEKTVTVPIKFQEKEIKKSLPTLLNIQPPVHGPVVINLRDDSSGSESECENSHNLNSTNITKTKNDFKQLKIGTVSVQNRITTRLVNDAKSEQHLKLIRIMKRDRQELNALKVRLAKKRLLLFEAEKKAKHLKEQLEATNKIVNANQASIVQINNQIKVTQARANERYAKVKAVFSQGKNMAKFPVVLRSQVPNQASLKKQRCLQIAEEKKRLLKREQEIALQLKRLQEANKMPSRRVLSPGSTLPVKKEIKSNRVAENNKLTPQLKLNNNILKINTQPLVEKAVAVVKVAATHNLDLFALPKIENIEIPFHLSKMDDKNFINSPLTHLKAYRLSKHFDGKFTSTTYANKIDPDWTLCSFDLRGTCNDDQCPWQHSTNYTLTPEETLVDLALYAPSVLDENFTSNQSALFERVKPLLKKEPNLEIACNKLVLEIKQSGNHNMILDRRKLVTQKEKKANVTNSIPKEIAIDDDYKECSGEDGQRYYSDVTQKSEDLEEILKEDPTNVDLWLQLAELSYKKCIKSTSKNFDRTLHILSRALEKNKTNEKLWLKYLSIYKQHEKNDDFVELCNQALEFAFSYDIAELYLKSATNKFEVCERIWEFLENSAIKTSKDLNSIKALQLLLRQTYFHLDNSSQDAIRFLHECLKNGCRTLLLPQHLSFAWLVLIHLAAFSSLPFNLFSGFLSLRFDTSFTISWTNIVSLRKLIPIFKDAIHSSDKWSSPKDAFVIHWNLIELYVHCKDWTAAKKECQNAISKFPTLMDPVILYLKVLDEQANKTDLLEATHSAICQYEYSSRLRFVAALIIYKYESMEAAHKVITTFAKGLCGDTMLDPIYCFKSVLNLNQTLKLGKNKQTIIETEDMAYMWLSFSLFLFLDGQDSSCYLDTALIRTSCQFQRILIWSFYLHLNLNKDTTKWLQQVRRCLSSIDVSSQMDLVDTIIEYLTLEGKVNFLEILYNWMPNNSHILLRYIQLLVAKGDHATVSFVSRDAEMSALSIEVALLSIQSASRVLSAHQFSSLRSRFASLYPLESAFRSIVSENSHCDDAALSREGNLLNKNGVVDNNNIGKKTQGN